MRKAVFVFIAFALLIITSCKKSNPASYGTYTFKSVTYDLTHCQLVASNDLSGWNTNSAGPNINILFDSIIPTIDCIDTVIEFVQNVSSHNMVCVQIIPNNYSIYNSTGFGSNQTLKVNVANGKVAISGSNIKMANQNANGDSGVVSFNINQQ